MSSKESTTKSDDEVRRKSKDKPKKDDKNKELKTEEKGKKDRHSRDDKHKKHRSPDHRRRRSRSHSPSRSSNKNNERQRSSHNHRRRSRSRSRSKDRKRDTKRERRRSRSSSRDKQTNEKKRGRHRDELRNRKLFAMGLTESSSSGSSGPKATSEALAAAVMANTLLDSNQEKAIKAQLDQVKAITGVDLPKYYNPVAINPMKYAEQIKKRQLLWGQKKPEESLSAPEPTPTAKAHEQQFQADDHQQGGPSFNKWEKTNFGNSQANEKFRRLMGIKGNAEADQVADAPTVDSTKIFGQLEKEYERARAITHTQRGLGLGFSGASTIPPNAPHPE